MSDATASQTNKGIWSIIRSSASMNKWRISVSTISANNAMLRGKRAPRPAEQIIPITNMMTSIGFAYRN